MSFFDKIYDIVHTDLFKYVFHSGSDKVFVANISKISTFNEKRRKNAGVEPVQKLYRIHMMWLVWCWNKWVNLGWGLT